MKVVHMHMWEKMIPTRGKPNFTTRIKEELLKMLGSKEKHPLELVPYPYTCMDWRACDNIFFTLAEPPDKRGKFNIVFKLI